MPCAKKKYDKKTTVYGLFLVSFETDKMFLEMEGTHKALSNKNTCDDDSKEIEP